MRERGEIWANFVKLDEQGDAGVCYYSQFREDRNHLVPLFKKIETIAQSIHPGDPVSLILLGDEHKVVVRNMAFVERARVKF